MSNSLFKAKFKDLGSEKIHIKDRRFKRKGNNKNFKRGEGGAEMDKLMEFNSISTPSHTGSLIHPSGSLISISKEQSNQSI